MDPVHRSNRAVAADSQLSGFVRFVNGRTGLALEDYRSLHAFSTQDISVFWALFLDWSGALAGGSPEPVRTGSGMQNTRFFPALRVSWPENLLSERRSGEDDIALVSVDESGARAEITRAALRRRVQAAASGFAALGVRESDHVAAVVRNTIDTVVACLAVTSIGATWSSLAPDMGLQTAVARLQQLAPRVLVVHARTRHNGTPGVLPVSDLARALPSLVAVVRLDDDAGPAGGVDPVQPPSAVLETTLQALERSDVPRSVDQPWCRFPFDHPLFILFSSGTTGAPKAIVHGHGGTLIEHLKEHRLHCDLGPDDTVCFQTSTGWMMWNWTVSALAAGARLVLYDGSVSYPERDSFLKMAAREGVTVLGLSPAYLGYLIDAGVSGLHESLRRVRTILSTGSVLPPHLQRWAADHLAAAPIESISGGTDLLGCFVLGSPWSDTYAGESSCAGLGLDVQAWTPERGPRREGSGELVCVQPFPSRPVGLLHDPGDSRLHETYYAQHPGAWTHGDLIDMTPHGTVRVLGRCDGMLNIRGIRIGPSEIYDILARAIPEVALAMAVDAEAPADKGGRRLLLFVVLRRDALLDRALTFRIKKALKEGASAAHVPASVVAVDELPATFSNKLSETAMQDALSGRPIRNLAALRNPGAIDRAIEAWRRAP
jgi:acetoacetyl-CoA synthetase